MQTCVILVLGTYFYSSSLKIEACQQMRSVASLLHCWLLTVALLRVGSLFSATKKLGLLSYPDLRAK